MRERQRKPVHLRVVQPDGVRLIDAMQLRGHLAGHESVLRRSEVSEAAREALYLRDAEPLAILSDPRERLIRLRRVDRDLVPLEQLPAEPSGPRPVPPARFAREKPRHDKRAVLPLLRNLVDHLVEGFERLWERLR